MTASTQPLRDSGTRPSLASQALWLLFAKTLAFAFTIVLPLLLVRALDRQTYGEYRQAFLLITTAGMLLPMSIPLSAFYFFPREPRRHTQIVLNISLYHLCVATCALAVLWLWPRTIVYILGSENLARYAPAIGLVLFLTVFSSIAETIATAYQDVTASTLFIIGASLTKTTVLLAALWFSRSLAGLLTAAAVQGLLQSAALVWYLNSRFPRFWTDFDAAFLGVQIRYALPLGLSGILMIAQREAHQFYVSHVFGSAAYAIYAIGCFQLPLVALVRDSVASVLISRVSEYQQQNRISDIIFLTARGMRKLSLVYWPAMFFLLVWAEEFIVLLFTRSYLESVPVFRVNLLLLATVIPITDPLFRAFTEHRFFIVRVRILLMVLLISFLHFGVQIVGMPGAIGAVVAVTLIERAVVCGKSMAILNLKFSDLRLFRGSLTSGATAAVAVLPAYAAARAFAMPSPFVELLACGGIYVCTYVGLLQLLGFFEPDERQLITATLLKMRQFPVFARRLMSRAA